MDKLNILKSNPKLVWVFETEALLTPQVTNNQRNKLFERVWPLRLVAPLSSQARVKLSFGGNWLLWNFPSYFGKLMQDAAVNWNSQLT